MRTDDVLESPGDPVLQEDLEEIAAGGAPAEALKNSVILVSGATGLIGSLTVKALAACNRVQGLNLRLLPLVRSEEKARRVFGTLLEREDVELLVADLNEPLQLAERVDHIVHAAAVTSSREMVGHPVETILTSVNGTRHMLQLAARRAVDSFVYLSSMEVYGTFQSEADFDGTAMDGGVLNAEVNRVTEDRMGYIDPLQLRSNYPLCKRLCENMCVAYHAEYHVPVRIARLAQTFGAGVSPAEKRVFGQFAGSVLRGENIVLHTRGRSEGNYCYTSDTIRALITLMARGGNGEAYNVSNEKNHMTIAQMAQLVADKIAGGRIRVVYEIPRNNRYGYPADTKMLLDASKLRSLGWAPRYDLEESYRRMIESMRNTIASDRERHG